MNENVNTDQVENEEAIAIADDVEATAEEGMKRSGWLACGEYFKGEDEIRF